MGPQTQTSSPVNIGCNIRGEMIGEDLVLHIHTATMLGESASGKMITIASSGGFTSLPFSVGDKRLKLNLFLGVSNK